ncbi:hypothetical protein BT93_K2222 [Corymbia citriodora subsp. variegata]|nr:hypothetical protein BT93_K2222 [Corymbia citriodora subsp. variegata]
MAKLGVVNWMLRLRIVGLLALAGSMVLMVINHFTASNGAEVTYKFVDSYNYVLATAVIGAAYILVQLPFAIYYACIEKGMTRNEYLLEFEFYGDKLISLILATGVGAGFAASIEQQRHIKHDNDTRKWKNFLDLGIVSTALLALGFVCMIIVSMLSSINRNSSMRGGVYG